MLLPDKVEAIKNIAVPTTKKKIKISFITIEICGNIDLEF